MTAVDGRIWHDRAGRAHRERGVPPRSDEPTMRRVTGPLADAWHRTPQRRADLARDALSRPNPHVVPDPGAPGSSLWTWVVEAPAAAAVLLWTNPVFDHTDPALAELERLEGSALWTITLRLPSALRASYRIAVWEHEEEPPWRTAEGRRPVLLAAMAAGAVDSRGTDIVIGSRGEASSVAAGPDAPVEPWRTTAPSSASGSLLEEITLPDDERAWLYTPADATSPTPLLLLFDGDVWRRELPPILDRTIAAGILPPLHVAMLDAKDVEHRWEHLGVPGGQVDVLIDRLLPLVRGRPLVSTRPADTIISGQSLGGIAALWTLALSDGDVGHAIAQSPSLWRFDVADALATASGWSSLELQAGTFEGDMLADAAALAVSLRADARTAGRRVALSPFEAGHDWAVWRANLVGSLIALLG
ncbi:alpha/beta hydrolase [Microbacterium sp.]|uniref:alpha/beta hydrolase n=1 Tax=Microbacterium sp. TaxID=51671 RepID=UPI0039E5A985